MNGWEQRAKKLEAKRRRIKKHGRSLMSAVREAELKRAKRARKTLASSRRDSAPPDRPRQ
ncbi:MAG TPA: hypothetical protein VFY90_05305 [Tepidiformaceae bacterium]|nr:hypothetical protein [Tepidiformaceae bacterium]